MVPLLSFAVVVAVQLIDPVFVIGYTLAGYFSPRYSVAALTGTIPGLLSAALSVRLASLDGAPVPTFNAIAGVVSCSIGATIVHGIVRYIRARRAAQ